MYNWNTRVLAFLTTVFLLLSLLPAVAMARSDDPAASDEAIWERYWSEYWEDHPEQWAALETHDPEKKGAFTTLSAMRARAEAIVNYTWTPSSDIATWNNNPYNGKYIFPAGSTVKGMPYTLFTSEVVPWGLCSLEEYKAVASINYSATAYCTSVGAKRTGPVYGSCCADLVSEVFGGSFMYGSSPRYHNVRAFWNTSYGTTFHGQKMADIRAGDAVSDYPNHNHIIWIGDVTSTTLTVYEQTPPAAHKITLNKSDCTNDAGYFIFHGATYSTITRSNEFLAGPPTYAEITTDKGSYKIGETVVFSIDSNGDKNTLKIDCPNGETLSYEDAGSSYRLKFETAGHYQALVQARNDKGTFTGERVDFLVGAPTYATVAADQTSYAPDQSVTFSVDSDGDANTLWLFCPNGDRLYYQDVGTACRLNLGMSGHFQALVQAWNRVGSFTGDQIDFVIGPPTYATIAADHSSYGENESVTFSLDADGDTNTLWIAPPDGDPQSYEDVGSSYSLAFETPGHYQALVQTQNQMGSAESEPFDFVIGAPSQISAASNKASYQINESAVFTCASDGSANTLWIVYPDGSRQSYEDIPAFYALSFPVPGAYQAQIESRNRAGSGFSDVIEFTVECPHAYRSEVIAPTCTAQGYTAHTCPICGERYLDSFTDALGHAYIQEAAETGSTAMICTRCGERDTDPPPAESEHSYSYTVSEPPTAEKPGILTGTCIRCGDIRSISLPKLSETDYICQINQASTCAESGIGTYTWNTADYGSISFQAPIESLSHSYAAELISPTCTECGYTNHVCSACGARYQDAFTAAPGHIWDAGTVTKEPTETSCGIKTYVCTECGEQKTEILPTLTHRHSYSGTVISPTCTQMGYTFYQCSCGMNYISGQTPLAEHHYEGGICTQCGTYDQLFRFADVADETKFYYAPVYWALFSDPQITNGVDTSHFGPAKGCTRGQVVTFLWRAAGCPEPNRTAIAFQDVGAEAYYAKAVAWAVENNITNGVNAAAFAPNATCTRGQIVTFLWRFRESPAPSGAAHGF